MDRTYSRFLFPEESTIDPEAVQALIEEVLEECGAGKPGVGLLSNVPEASGLVNLVREGKMKAAVELAHRIRHEYHFDVFENWADHIARVHITEVLDSVNLWDIALFHRGENRDRMFREMTSMVIGNLTRSKGGLAATGQQVYPRSQEFLDPLITRVTAQPLTV